MFPIPRGKPSIANISIGPIEQSNLHQRRTKSNENLLNRQFDERNINDHSLPIKYASDASHALRNNGIELSPSPPPPPSSSPPSQQRRYQEMQNKQNTDYDNVVVVVTAASAAARTTGAAALTAALTDNKSIDSSAKVIGGQSGDDTIATTTVEQHNKAIRSDNSAQHTGDRKITHKKMEFHDQGKFNMMNLGLVIFLYTVLMGVCVRVNTVI